MIGWWATDAQTSSKSYKKAEDKRTAETYESHTIRFELFSIFKILKNSKRIQKPQVAFLAENMFDSVVWG